MVPLFFFKLGPACLYRKVIDCWVSGHQIPMLRHEVTGCFHLWEQQLVVRASLSALASLTFSSSPCYSVIFNAFSHSSSRWHDITWAWDTELALWIPRSLAHSLTAIARHTNWVMTSDRHSSHFLPLVSNGVDFACEPSLDMAARCLCLMLYIIVIILQLNWRLVSHNLHLTLLPFWRRCSHCDICLFPFLFNSDC